MTEWDVINLNYKSLKDILVPLKKNYEINNLMFIFTLFKNNIKNYRKYYRELPEINQSTISLKVEFFKISKDEI